MKRNNRLTMSARQEKREHPWATMAMARRIAADHSRKSGDGGRVIVERTVYVPVSRKRKRIPPRSDWWNML